MAASNNEYIKEAFDQLEVISWDEMKRMEYNARQKAIWDYNTLMEENFSRGLIAGVEKGRAEGRAEGRADLLAELFVKMKASGLSDSQINAILNS